MLKFGNNAWQKFLSLLILSWVEHPSNSPVSPVKDLFKIQSQKVWPEIDWIICNKLIFCTSFYFYYFSSIFVIGLKYSSCQMFGNVRFMINLHRITKKFSWVFCKNLRFAKANTAFLALWQSEVKSSSCFRLVIAFTDTQFSNYALLFFSKIE